MPRRLLARRGAVLAVVCAVVAATPVASAAPRWERHPLTLPNDPQTLMELGPPGDLQFRPGSTNRALLAIEGKGTFPRMGLFTYDGQAWTPLAEVCGAEADNARIAWAGPREFWTIAQPSAPRGGNGGEYINGGDGLGLCHFRDGQVVGSYSRPPSDPDRLFELEAAACAGPADCWFGGIGADDPTGSRFGAFHVRWDGSSLGVVYAPQGRGVTDLGSIGGTFVESVLRRRSQESQMPPDLAAPEPVPALLHTIQGSAFHNVDWFPNRDLDSDGEADVPADGTELNALDVDGDEVWAVGGGAPLVSRGPVAAHYAGGDWQEVPLVPGHFDPNERFTDVAAIPGSADAWVVAQPAFGDLSRGRPSVVRLSPTGAVLDEFTGFSDKLDGAAAKIDCASVTECWLATYRGILYHYTDPAGPQPPQDVDPAFSEVIRERPNEAIPQVVPDALPVDDSLLFAPPPIELPKPPPSAPRQPRRCQPRPALVDVVRSAVRGRTRLVLEVTVRLRRRARVQLVGFRGKRLVGRSSARRLRRGRHTLEMQVRRDRFPQRLRFRTRELTRPTCRRGGSAPEETFVTTGSSRRTGRG